MKHARLEFVEVSQHRLSQEAPSVELATPLTAWLPTQARCAMRTYFSPPSSISDSREIRSRVISGSVPSTSVEKPPVDFVDDLKVPGQWFRKSGSGPFFERLRKKRMVRVGEGARVISQAGSQSKRLVHQKPHEFGDRNRWVRVVHLHRPA